MTVLFREQDDKEAPDARLLVNVESDKAGRPVIYLLLSIYTKYHLYTGNSLQKLVVPDIMCYQLILNRFCSFRGSCL